MNSIETSRFTQEWNKIVIAKTIGWCFITMFFLGIFAEFFVRTRLINWEDPTLTFTNIQESLALFNSGIFASPLFSWMLFYLLPFMFYSVQ